MKQLYPSWRFHADGRAVIVQDPEEESRLGPGWADSPAAFESKIGAEGHSEPVAQPTQIPAPQPSAKPDGPLQETPSGKKPGKKPDKR
ncbi:MAG: hypothetical protein ABFD89_29335 [Bryobacteraceae bacterium]